MNSRIGRKLLLAIILCIVLTVSIVTTVTVAISGNYNSTLMMTMTNSGMSVLMNGMDTQIERLETIYELLNATELLGPETAEAREALLEEHETTDEDFAALCSTNGVIYWQSSNFKLADFSYSKVGSNGYKGIVMDSAAGLTIQCARPITIDGSPAGAIVIGMHLNETTWIDKIKEETSSEITIFSGNTRYATTVINKSGVRAVGTNMSDTVAKTVISEGQSYEGTAVVLEQNHFVNYEPMKDINGKVVGAYFCGLSSKASDELQNSMIFISLIVAVIVAGASLFVIGSISIRMIITPIKEVEKLADSMSQGILNEPPLDFKFGNNELGDFARKLEKTKRILNEYVSDINAVLSEMATGNFTATPQVEYVGDFAGIGRSFIGIKASLSEIIGNINTSSEAVMNQSVQIADGSQAVADGTTRQAAAINQLSASVNDIAGKVQQSAENAGEARKIAALSAEKINDQSSEIGDMLAAMEEIKEKSDRIQNIMKDINDIASQTNILALNAAIEAARAGEAGKGFAVVAGEVGNLAVKTGESAKQTGELINATIEAVKKGTVIAQNTANTMNEVNDLSNRTNDYIVDISTAADEQAGAISQVKIGIEEISNVIQQNSATAEQTAASCSILSDQSSLLKEQIDKLKVES